MRIILPETRNSSKISAPTLGKPKEFSSLALNSYLIEVYGFTVIGPDVYIRQVLNFARLLALHPVGGLLQDDRLFPRSFPQAVEQTCVDGVVRGEYLFRSQVPQSVEQLIVGDFKHGDRSILLCLPEP
ncbi:hypothetical protein J6590_019404 [Homalodisca vitripennis]|nr:hypothetical protein J6590_019404 [Homalodisca vitripennis]